MEKKETISKQALEINKSKNVFSGVFSS
jgi:hypothetical protein